jgi:hypothetical protein
VHDESSAGRSAGRRFVTEGELLFGILSTPPVKEVLGSLLGGELSMTSATLVRTLSTNLGLYSVNVSSVFHCLTTLCQLK